MIWSDNMMDFGEAIKNLKEGKEYTDRDGTEEVCGSSYRFLMNTVK